jgi:uncharacterized low-complexity protein
MMRNLLTALAGAALLAGAATVALAQTAQTQNQTNPNTKVYAYQKATAPKPASPGTDATMARQNHPTEHLLGSVPFGSPKWWEVMGRTSNGEGSQ